MAVTQSQTFCQVSMLSEEGDVAQQFLDRFADFEGAPSKRLRGRTQGSARVAAVPVTWPSVGVGLAGASSTPRGFADPISVCTRQHGFGAVGWFGAQLCHPPCQNQSRTGVCQHSQLHRRRCVRHRSQRHCQSLPLTSASFDLRHSSAGEVQSGWPADAVPHQSSGSRPALLSKMCPSRIGAAFVRPVTHSQEGSMHRVL